MFLRLKNLMNKLHVYPNNNLSNQTDRVTQLYSDLGAIRYVSLVSSSENSIMEAVKSNYYAGNIPYNSTIEGTISYQGIWGINGYTYPEGKDYCSFILHKYGDDRTVHIRNMNGTWNFVEEATKDDLGVTEYNAGKSISISGKLSDIGAWLQTNGVTSRWMSVRANPTNDDGYFGRSTFSILWQSSSSKYGWCILMSDNTKMVVFGRNSEGWHWYAPSLTEVS